MFFVIGIWSTLVEEKNERPLTKSSFIYSVSNGVVENSCSICYECKVNRYKATMFGLIWPYFIIADLIS